MSRKQTAFCCFEHFVPKKFCFMETIENLTDKCPLRTAPFERVFDDFYFDKSEHGCWIRRYSAKDRGTNKQITKWEVLPELIVCKNKWWKLSKVFNIHWEEGQHHNQKTRKDLTYVSGYPVHFHTDLIVFDKRFHIDFYAIAYWAPGSSLKEIRVYKDEDLVARGGRGNVTFCVFVQNLPFIVPVEDSILLFHFSSNSFREVKFDISISLWRNCDNFPTHKITRSKN